MLESINGFSSEHDYDLTSFERITFVTLLVIGHKELGDLVGGYSNNLDEI